MVMQQAESVLQEAQKAPLLVPAWRRGRAGIDIAQASNVEEALTIAGLNWDVGVNALYLSNRAKVDYYNAVVRSDNHDVIGVVGPRYEAFQNRDAFAWMDGLLEHNVRYETAGALKGGRLVWVLARLNDSIEIVEGDDVAQYLLVATGHDGFAALTVKFTPVRVVCENTLRMALGGGGAAWKAHHTEAISGRMEEARSVLDAATNYFGRATEQMKRLSKVRIDAAAEHAFAGKLFEIKSERVEAIFNGETAKGREQAALEVVRLAHEGRGNNKVGVEGTVWALYNGATEWHDYYKGSQLEGSERDEHDVGRVLMYADGQSFRQRAWDAATELIK